MNSAEVTGFNMYTATYEEWKAMKMAKANENDLQVAMDLCGAFEALTQRWSPVMPEAIQNCEPEDCEHFDRDNDEQCGRALRHLIDIANRGSLMRVVWGMSVLLDPANKVVDPDADTLEHHPERVAAESQLANLRERVTEFELDIVPELQLSLKEANERLDKLREGSWKQPQGGVFPDGTLLIQVDLRGGDICTALVYINDEDNNTLHRADDFGDVWTDYEWDDVDRYIELSSLQSLLEQTVKEKSDEQNDG